MNFSAEASTSTSQEELVSDVDNVQPTGTSQGNDSAVSDSKEDNSKVTDNKEENSKDTEEPEKANTEETKSESGYYRFLFLSHLAPAYSRV